jgi:hemerythrin-like domain-containing protein
MARRHQSLIPLSHQHQHALALAVIIRRKFGKKKDETAWYEEMISKIQKLYAGELRGHFEVEEEVLFPEMERYLGKLPLVDELVRDHVALRGLVRGLESIPEVAALNEFSRMLEAHVRKEERKLFPEFEKRMPAAEALKLGGEILTRLVNACTKF